MSSPLQSGILRALFVALKPLARALLRAGVGYREFADVAKAAFIQEASSEFGLRGRPTNTSRVAVMTGITRKEVKRLRDKNIDDLLSGPITESPASIILSRWFGDLRFCDSRGMPKILDYAGHDNSFVQLVAAYAGDIPAGAMKAELKRVGAIEELPGKKLAILKRYFVPTGLDDRLIIGLVDVAGASLSTLAFNCDLNRKKPARYHRVAGIDDAPLNALHLIEAEANERLGEFAEKFDSFLINTCSSEPDKRIPRSGIQVGIGLYYFEREIDQ